MEDHLDLQIEQAGEVTGFIGLSVEASVLHQYPQQSAIACVVATSFQAVFSKDGQSQNVPTSAGTICCVINH